MATKIVTFLAFVLILANLTFAEIQYCEKSTFDYAGKEICDKCKPISEKMADGTCVPCQDANCADCMYDHKGCYQCNLGFYFDTQTNTCTPCSAGCASCQNGSQCDKCSANYMLSELGCLQCPPGCSSCTSPTVCTECVRGKYSPVSTGSPCSATCPAECETCTSETACQSCVAPNVLTEGKCTNQDKSTRFKLDQKTILITTGAVIGLILILVIVYCVCCRNKNPHSIAYRANSLQSSNQTKSTIYSQNPGYNKYQLLDKNKEAGYLGPAKSMSGAYK